MVTKNAFANAGWDSDETAQVASDDATGLMLLQGAKPAPSEQAIVGVATGLSLVDGGGSAGTASASTGQGGGDVSAAAAPPIIGETPRNAGSLSASLDGDHTTNTGVGRTVRTGIAVVTSVGTGSVFNNQDINGILSGNAWGSAPGAQTLTFSFPTSSSQYGTGFGTGTGQYNDPAPFNGFQALTAAQQNVVRYALGLVSQYTQLSFSEITETNTTHATLRFAGSAQPPTSYAYYPATTGPAGDAFYGNVRNSAPTKAGYAFDTIMHEIGHNLGLKHGQEANATYGTVGAAHLSTEWSIMTYQAYVGTPDNFYSNAEGSGNQTYMIDDIAALQYLYGANFNTNATATIYTWSPTTGEMFINGVGQGASSTNKIYEAIWDGNGVDTYNLSNYTTAVSIDLQPGNWSTFSSAQLADLDKAHPGVHLAHGNISNANLFNGDLRSIIENATGGSGNDIIIGNQGANTLTGSGGNDSVSGLTGNDILVGGDGDDVLTGGAGADRLTGGNGADTFNMFAGDSTTALRDNITDFQTGIDKLDVRGISGGLVNITHTATGSTAFYHFVFGGGYTESITATGNIQGRDIVADSGTIIYNHGTTAAESLYGGAGVDYLYGDDGADRLRGGLGADVLEGDGGADKFDMYAGESLVATPDSIVDFVHGVDNIDILNIAGGQVTLNHVTSSTTDVYYHAVSGTLTELIHVTGDVEAPDIVADQGTQFTINGGSGVDVLVGGAANDTISGNDGADSLNGAGGDDILRGGLGADTLTGGAGIDKFNMFAGESLAATADTITDFSTGVDILDVRSIPGGRVLLDHLTATTTDVRYNYVGNNPNELIRVTGSVAASDVAADAGTAFGIFGSSAAETFVGGAVGDDIRGGAGDDTLNGLGGNDILRGGLGADIMTGGSEADTFDMYEGESLSATYDTITDFQRGVDKIDVRGIPGGSILLYHSAGRTDVAYHLVSGSYTEVIGATGDVEGADIVFSLGDVIVNYGYAAAETLVGGSRSDVFYGNGGADTLTGGAGVDTFAYQSLSDSTGAAYDTITDFIHGTDKIDLSAVSGGLVGLFHNDAGNVGVGFGYTSDGFASVIFSAGDVEADDVYTAAGAQFYISGGALAETLVGSAGSDTIQGNGGADIIVGGGGFDYMSGGDGADTFKYLTLADSNLSAYDIIADFTSGADKLDLTAVSGSFINLVADGAGGAYAFYGFGSGGPGGVVHTIGAIQAADVIAAPGATFYLSGSAANDLLVGGGGADTLEGGGGQDTLYGGGGADVFRYSTIAESTLSAPDYVGDFQHGVDKIDFTGMGAGAVTISHPGYGGSFVYFAPNGASDFGFVGVSGDVEAADLLVAAGVTVTISGAFSGPEPQPDAFHG